MTRQFVCITAPGQKCEWADRFPREVIVYEKDKDLDNFGMEIYGNLHYIYYHYNKLPNIVIFAHPDVLKHAPKFFERVEQIDTPEFLALGGLAESNENGEPHHGGLHILDTVNELGLTPPKHYTFTPGGTFSVGREKILDHPRSFYKKAIEIVTRNRFRCGEQVYIFERLWGLIFNADWNLYVKKWGLNPRDFLHFIWAK